MSQVQTGAKLALKINGQLIAYATNVTYTINHNHQPIETFGQPAVTEYAELGVTCEFTASHFRVATKAALQLGLQPTIANFLSQPTLTMTITDMNNVTLVQGSGIKMTSRQGTVDARGVFTESLSFVSQVIGDETGPNTPPNQIGT